MMTPDPTMTAISDNLRDAAEASNLPGEWYNTAMSLRDAACLLIEAAEQIVSGDHAAGVPSWRIQTPEQGAEWALSCIRRVYDGERVRPVLPLGYEDAQGA